MMRTLAWGKARGAAMRRHASLGALIAVAVCLAGLAPLTHAQTLLFALNTPNPQSGAGFGAGLALGDVNGDGNADIAVAAPGEDVGGNPDQGRVYVFSGADRSLLFALNTPNAQASAGFGSLLAAGDVNGDDRVDIAAT